MAEKMICPVCGEPTSSYMGNYRKDRLCKKHATEFKNGNIIQCDNCGKWHNVGTLCQCGRYTFTELPTEGFNKCVACGAETTGYAFCRKCFKKYDEDEMLEILNKADFKFISIADEKDYIDFDETPIERQRQEDGNCIVCGEEAPNGSLCRECYYEMLDYKDTFDKNAKIFELKDYYFNLRSNIYRMKNFDYVQSNCNKLMALAVLTKDLFGEQSLTDRVVTDIKDIIEKKSPKEKQTSSEYTKIQDARREEVNRTADGHYVKSYPESVIDDILYDLRIVHCYEKKVPISAEEQTITADWFIPVTDSRHGIYIEYWGMNTKEYLENKDRKRKSYKEHDIPLIEIEKDDYKDRRGLEDRLLSEINSLAKKYFHITDFKK